ncbi:hypothetical protein O6H91_02G064100 [Diphasiastrum complanatum]|uniref:Uncharacterized protein n=1 Tax=Diphasiastrum complanatum TaxID=34168 RepID=A0ACC2EGD3_DIPCM|nr:hypothetical protein O6H91_02G064100 [Diphasiastrum complanatum]
MRGREEIALSFDANPGLTAPQQRRAAGFVTPQPQFRTPMMPSSGGGQGGTSGLPFLSFDLGASSSAPPPRVGSYGGGNGGFASFEDEAPLLEELGINPRQIAQKTFAVLNPLRANADLHEDGDLSGPFVFCLLFGLCQLLAGKFHFGIILGWGSLASLFLYVVFNLLAGRNGSLDLYRCCSLVGYCVIPMIIFSALSIFIPQGGPLSFTLGLLTILWCTRSCTSLLVVLAPCADEHKFLVAYACVIIYSAFAMLVIF